MKHLVLMLLVAGIVFPAVAMADDRNPPPWRYEPNTTFSHWDQWLGASGEKTESFAPDDEFNYLGESAQATSDAPVVEVIDYAGSEDVLHIEDYGSYKGLVLTIPNYPDPNPYKEVVLQVVWHWDGGPGYAIDPLGEMIDSQLSYPLGNDWYYDYIVWRIEPNPTSETITLTNEWGDLYIDQIVVDTICAPEPTTIGLVMIGALVALRRRS